MKIRNSITAFDAIESAAQQLTFREKEVLDLVVKGYTSRRIADALGVTFYTATTHLKNIYKKLGIHKRTELFIVFLGGRLRADRPPSNQDRLLPLLLTKLIDDANFQPKD